MFFQNTMFVKRCQTRAEPVPNPYCTRANPLLICSGSEGSHLCHCCCNIETYWNILIWNRHRHRNYWWVMLAIHAIQWLRGSWAPRVSQPRVCWGLRPRMLEYAGIGWFYSFLSSPSKLQTWKHRVLWKNLVFFHILRFCRVFEYQGIYIYHCISLTVQYPHILNIET